MFPRLTPFHQGVLSNRHNWTLLYPKEEAKDDNGTVKEDSKENENKSQNDTEMTTPKEETSDNPIKATNDLTKSDSNVDEKDDDNDNQEDEDDDNDGDGEDTKERIQGSCKSRYSCSSPNDVPSHNTQPPLLTKRQTL